MDLDIRVTRQSLLYQHCELKKHASFLSLSFLIQKWGKQYHALESCLQIQDNVKCPAHTPDISSMMNKW